MTERDPTRDRPDDAPDEPLDLEEARAARALAQALEGGEAGGNPAVHEALEGAARVASVRSVELSEEAKVRIAEDLFGPARRRRGPVRWALAAASVAAAAAIALVVWPSAERAPSSAAGAETAALRREAGQALASLMPAATPVDRAHLVAAAARARLEGRGTP